MAVETAHKLDEKWRSDDIKLEENLDFPALLLSDRVLKGLKKAGFRKPSPVQLRAIPLGRCGLDLVVQAKSGTGKTCVFTVVALESLLDSPVTQILVLAPTREIAAQIRDVVNSIGCAFPKLACQMFIGGIDGSTDKENLRNCQIAVGTPGRVRSLIEQKLLQTQSIRMFVLDEADKLITESFVKDINYIFSTLPTNKQVLALSATYPKEVAKHLTNYMRNPSFVRLNTSDLALKGILQFYCLTKHHPMPHIAYQIKTEVLWNIINTVVFSQCLVFCNLLTKVESLCDDLNTRGFPTASISSMDDQETRLETLYKLKTFQCRVLITSDLTSRGIDAENVDLIINMDLPYQVETYLHRVGRCGRYGTKGTAISLVSVGDEEIKLSRFQETGLEVFLLPDPLPSNLTSLEKEMFVQKLELKKTPNANATSQSQESIVSTSDTVADVTKTAGTQLETINQDSAEDANSSFPKMSDKVASSSDPQSAELDGHVIENSVVSKDRSNDQLVSMDILNEICSSNNGEISDTKCIEHNSNGMNGFCIPDIYSSSPNNKLDIGNNEIVENLSPINAELTGYDKMDKNIVNESSSTAVSNSEENPSLTTLPDSSTKQSSSYGNIVNESNSTAVSNSEENLSLTFIATSPDSSTKQSSSCGNASYVSCSSETSLSGLQEMCKCVNVKLLDPIDVLIDDGKMSKKLEVNTEVAITTSPVINKQSNDQIQSSTEFIDDVMQTVQPSCHILENICNPDMEMINGTDISAILLPLLKHTSECYQGDVSFAHVVEDHKKFLEENDAKEEAAVNVNFSVQTLAEDKIALLNNYLEQNEKHFLSQVHHTFVQPEKNVTAECDLKEANTCQNHQGGLKDASFAPVDVASVEDCALETVIDAKMKDQYDGGTQRKDHSLSTEVNISNEHSNLPVDQIREEINDLPAKDSNIDMVSEKKKESSNDGILRGVNKAKSIKMRNYLKLSRKASSDSPSAKNNLKPIQISLPDPVTVNVGKEENANQMLAEKPSKKQLATVHDSPFSDSDNKIKEPKNKHLNVPRHKMYLTSETENLRESESDESIDHSRYKVCDKCLHNMNGMPKKDHSNYSLSLEKRKKTVSKCAHCNKERNGMFTSTCKKHTTNNCYRVRRENKHLFSDTSNFSQLPTDFASQRRQSKPTASHYATTKSDQKRNSWGCAYRKEKEYVQCDHERNGAHDRHHNCVKQANSNFCPFSKQRIPSKGCVLREEHKNASIKRSSLYDCGCQHVKYDSKNYDLFSGWRYRPNVSSHQKFQSLSSHKQVSSHSKCTRPELPNKIHSACNSHCCKCSKYCNDNLSYGNSTDSDMVNHQWIYLKNMMKFPH